MFTMSPNTCLPEVRSYMCALFSWGMKSDKSPVMDVVQSKFDIPFNPVTAIPTLACESYVGERYLSFDELGQLLKDAHSGEHFIHDISVFLKLVFFCCGQRPYEILAAKKEHYNRDAQLLSIPPEIVKTKKWYHIALSPSAIELIDEMCLRYPESEYLFPDIRYESKMEGWITKEKEGTLKKNSVKPTPFISTSILSENIRRERVDMQSFTPRDFRRTFKTLGGQIKLSKEIRDRIQNHNKSDVSSKHYGRYDYFEEKMEAVLKWESFLLNLIN